MSKLSYKLKSIVSKLFGKSFIIHDTIVVKYKKNTVGNLMRGILKGSTGLKGRNFYKM